MTCLQVETTAGELVSRIGFSRLLARVLARHFAARYRRPMVVRDLDSDEVVYRATWQPDRP